MSATVESLEIRPEYSREATVTVPGSKSLSNRALVVAAVAEGESRISGLLRADDTKVMLDALAKLGVRLSADGTEATVSGHAGPIASQAAELDVNYSGTTLRFLLPLLAAGNGEFILTGRGRMLERPIQDQLDALKTLGADAASLNGNGCPPVRLVASGLNGGSTVVQGGRSSQYLSGLLLAAPLAAGPVEITVAGELQSKPFVDLTLGVMRDFGISVEREGHSRFLVRPGTYRAADYRVEGDATAAGNFWVAAAVTGSRVTVTNVGRESTQGDTALLGVLEKMGCTVSYQAGGVTVQGPGLGSLRGGEFDLNDFPDQALALAVAGLFTDSPLTIRNVPNMRIKETDRLAALATELRRIGAEVQEGSDSLTVRPGSRHGPADIHTYADHRMAMAFAVAGLRQPGIRILDPGCVDKTYPDYWRDFAALQQGAAA